MRSALVLVPLVLLTGSVAVAVADREHPQPIEQERPRPCKCIKREPQLTYEVRGREVGPFAERVAGRARVYNRGIRQCLASHHAETTELAFTFAKRATEPRISVAGAPALAACLARITWHSFDAAPRATTVRVRVSDQFGI
jgi:hypothetical protein